jgi:hypothetical protein
MFLGKILAGFILRVGNPFRHLRRRAGAACGVVHARHRCFGIVAAGDGRGRSTGYEYSRAPKRFDGGVSSNRDHGAAFVSEEESRDGEAICARLQRGDLPV